MLLQLDVRFHYVAMDPSPEGVHALPSVFPYLDCPQHRPYCNATKLDCLEPLGNFGKKRAKHKRH